MLECSKINVSMVNGEQGFTLKWSCSSMDPKSLVEVYGKMWPERPIYLMVKKHAKKNMVSQQIFPSTNPSMKRKRSRRRTPRVASSPWSCLIFSSELGFPGMGVPPIGGFIRENPIEMDDDWGYPNGNPPSVLSCGIKVLEVQLQFFELWRLWQELASALRLSGCAASSFKQ